MRNIMKHTRLIHLLIIAAAALLAYSNTFHVPFQFDDILYITKNPIIKNLDLLLNPAKHCSGIPSFADEQFYRLSLNMRYIGHLSFAMNYRLHGLNVMGYHITNILIHIINAFFVYFFVTLTFQIQTCHTSQMRADSKLVALFSSLLFVLHPIQTQAVTYLTQRFASLATMFYLLAFISYIKWRLTYDNAKPGIVNKTKHKTSNFKSLFFYIMSLISTVFAMKTKEIAFTLPIMITLYEYTIVDQKTKTRFLYLLPFLISILIIPLSLTGFKLTGFLHDIHTLTGFQTSMGGPQPTISWWEYLFTEFRVILTYLRLLVFPVNQNLDYDYPIYHSFFNPEVFLSFIFLLSICMFGIYLLCRYRKIYPCSRLIAFGIFWFFITLSIESSIIPIVDVIFEHRLYLSSIGLFISFTAALYGLKNTCRDRWKAGNKSVIIIFICISVCLGIATYMRNHVWQNPIRLWEDVMKKSPNKPRAYFGLAYNYQNAKNYEKAIEMYSRGIALDPTYFEAYYNLGILSWQLGQYDKAIYYFNSAIALHPYSDRILDNRGRLYFIMGQYDKAIVDLTGAIKIHPNIENYYKNRGRAYAQQRQYKYAINDFTSAVHINPNDPEIYGLRGLSYSLLGDAVNAFSDFQKSCGMGYRQACDALGKYNR
jgi:protein O-mannosyl-transferase